MEQSIELKCTCKTFGKCTSNIKLEEYEEGKFLFEYRDTHSSLVTRRIYTSKEQLIKLRNKIDELINVKVS